MCDPFWIYESLLDQEYRERYIDEDSELSRGDDNKTPLRDTRDADRRLS